MNGDALLILAIVIATAVWLISVFAWPAPRPDPMAEPIGEWTRDPREDA